MPSVARARIATSPTIDVAAGRRLEGGFTLLELLVVLVMMAMIAAASLSFGGRSLTRSQPEVVAYEIAQSLRRTRARAIAENRDQAFEVDVESRTVQAGGEAPRRVPAGLDLALVAATTERRSRTSGGIRFYPDGSSTGGEIRVADARQAFLVEVGWLTGSVEVVRGSPTDGPRR